MSKNHAPGVPDNAWLPYLDLPSGQKVLIDHTDNINLFEVSGNQWLDRSRVGSYTEGIENRWRFCQFGNATLASNQTDPIQVNSNNRPS